MKRSQTYGFIQLGRQLRTISEQQLFQALAIAIVAANGSEEIGWRVFRGADGMYAIADTGAYYKSYINSNGEIELCQGKNHIYLGRTQQGYTEAFRISSL